MFIGTDIEYDLYRLDTTSIMIVYLNLDLFSFMALTHMFRLGISTKKPF
jgi:hypothetical protein